MPTHYSPLPNSGSDHLHAQEVEMEAAFNYSEDEDEDHNNSESQPLNPNHTSPQTTRASPPTLHVPGTYDFENLDYDYPPPGSPPRPSQIALPNTHGNSNGLIPSFSLQSAPAPHRNWFKRAIVAVLPPQHAQRLGLASQRPTGVIGGGTNNDGVFANVTAKPTRPVRLQEGDDGTYIAPEDTQPEAPPSYASAQADAVPPYWETTVHAPFTPDSIGEMIIDSLPSGSLFSFLWNMLVSISFQFVGFLLTYLLHTTHAARFGSRAGLGVTLIQYGFALRSRVDSANGADGGDMSWGSESPRTANSYYHHGTANATVNMPTATMMSDDEPNPLATVGTTEWLSFFLMTVGWFILLTSLLGFWRVKRWERGILASQRDGASTTPQLPQLNFAAISRFHRTFGLNGTSGMDLLRQGFGFGGTRNTSAGEERATRSASAVEEGRVQDDHALESDPMITAVPSDLQRSRFIAQAFANESRLQSDLRTAGLL